jgi:hypothetical protein
MCFCAVTGSKQIHAEPATPSPLRRMPPERLAVRAAHLIGLGKFGMVPSIIVTSGLILPRRRDQAIVGAEAACHWGGLRWLLGRPTSSRAS